MHQVWIVNSTKQKSFLSPYYQYQYQYQSFLSPYDQYSVEAVLLQHTIEVNEN